MHFYSNYIIYLNTRYISKIHDKNYSNNSKYNELTKTNIKNKFKQINKYIYKIKKKKKEKKQSKIILFFKKK